MLSHFQSAIPLHITETLVRTGGSTGRVRVTYTVEYVYGNTVMSGSLGYQYNLNMKSKLNWFYW